jgi:hypothetical protein
MRLQFVEKENGPERLLGEVEIVFDEEGPLAGMKLVGFSIWQGTDGESLTFPARSFGAGGERRFYDLLRGVEPGTGEPRRVRDWILSEWKAAKAA